MWLGRRGGTRSTAAALALALVPGIAEGEAARRTAENGAVAPAKGAWVRIEAPDVVDRRLVGHVVEVDERNLTLSLEGDVPLVVPRDAIARIEVSVGKRRSVITGLLVGAASGLLLGTVLPPDERSRGEMVGDATLRMAITGALVGLLVKRTKWVALDDERLGLAVSRRVGGGLAMEVSLSF